MNIKLLSSEQFIKIFTGLTMFSTILGFIIINFYLGKYSICSYTIVGSKTIYTGALFIFIVAASIVILFAFIENEDYTKNSNRSIFLNFIIKPIYLSNLVGVFTQHGKELTIYKIFDTFSINSILLCSLLMGITFVGITYKMGQYGYIKDKNDKWGCLWKKITDYMLFISIIPFPIMMYFNEQYKDAFLFFLGISFNVMMYCARKKEIAVTCHESSINNPSIFTKRKDGENDCLLEKILSGCIVIFMIYLLMFFYSRSIYPLIPEEYGGAYVKKNVISTINSENIEGRIIHRDESYYYLLIKDNIVRLIKLTEINFIRIENKH